MKKVGIVAFAAVALVLMLVVGKGFGFYNTSIKLENSIKAQWSQNQNNYDAFWKTISEMAQIPDKYKEDFQEVLVGNVEARYGEGGSKAQFQWIQEHSVNYDSSMYKKLMTAIEAGRKDFENNQKLLLDKKRRLEDHLQSVGGAFWCTFTDFPRELSGDVAPPKDLDGDGLLTALDYPIVTSGKTKAAFAAGEDEAMNVFGKKDE